MTDIGEAANLQRGALYYHIGSKEELLFDLCKRHVEEALERGRDAIMAADDGVAQFRALARAHVQTLLDRHSDVVVAEREMHWLTGDRLTLLNRIRHDYQDLFTEVLARAAAQGSIREITSIDVMGVLGMLNYTYVWLRPDGRNPVAEVADSLSELVLAGLNQ